MRLGVHLGPFYASTSTRRRRGKGSGGGWIAGFFGLLLLIGWPFLLGQKPNGGNYGWVWAIAVPWWILLALAVLGLLAGRKEAAAKAAAEAAVEDKLRMEATHQELAAREAAALEALDEAKRTGWLRLDGETAYAYAGVTPYGHRCHHRHRSPQAAAECAASLAKTA
jgi:hypothetical protein